MNMVFIAILLKYKGSEKIYYRGYSRNKHIIKSYLDQKGIKKRYIGKYLTINEDHLAYFIETYNLTEITEREDGVFLSEVEYDFINEYFGECMDTDLNESLYMVKDYMKIFNKSSPILKKLKPLFNEFINKKVDYNDDFYGDINMAKLYRFYLKYSNILEVS